MTPRVSVIVPCYRQARFLPECFSSLEGQTFTGWEMLIVNDGSPDDTIAVAEGLIRRDARVRLLNRLNGGRSAARNSGIEASRGRYIQFVDADDLLEPRKLERHVQALDTDPTLSIIYGNAWYFPDGDRSNRVRQGFGPDPDDDWIPRRAHEPGSAVTRLVQHNLLPVCNALFRRSLVDVVGPMDETLRVLEDWEFWIRCANASARFQFDPTPQTEALIRLHPASVSQDRILMATSSIAMRLRVMRYLRDRKARRLTLHAIGRVLASRNEISRETVYAELARSTRGLEEWFALSIARYFGPQTAAHQYARPLIRLLPWHVRSLATGR